MNIFIIKFSDSFSLSCNNIGLSCGGFLKSIDLLSPGDGLLGELMKSLISIFLESSKLIVQGIGLIESSLKISNFNLAFVEMILADGELRMDLLVRIEKTSIVSFKSHDLSSLEVEFSGQVGVHFEEVTVFLDQTSNSLLMSFVLFDLSSIFGGL